MAGTQSGRSATASLRRREVRTLAGYAVALLVCAVPLASMLAGAWDAEGIAFHLVWGVVRALGVNVDAAVVFPFGAFVGLLAVLWFDDVKRIQAALITLAAVPVGVLLYVRRWGINVAFLPQLPALVAGVALGFLAGGGYRVVTEDPLREFRRAFRGMYAIASALVVAAFFERHVGYDAPIRQSADGLTVVAGGLDPALVTEGIAVDAVATLAFVVILRAFVRYEDTLDIAVVGPARSGRTTMMTGLFRHAAEGDETRCTPNDANYELGELYAELVARPGLSGVVEAVRPESFLPLEFEFMHGDLLSRYVTVRMPDYSGELVIDEFAAAVRSAAERRRDASPTRRLRGGDGIEWPDRATDLPPGELQELMAETVCESDTLVLAVPMADFVDDLDDDELPAYHDDDPAGPDPSSYLSVLDDVVTAYESLGDDRDVVVVVTMSDLVVDHFERENPGAIVEDYDDFRSYVRHRVFVLDEAGREFTHSVDDVHPFFFRMDDDGTPRTDAENIYGAPELLDRIASR